MRFLIFCFFSCIGFLAAPCSAMSFTAKDILTGKTVMIDPQSSQKGTVLLFLSPSCPCTNNSLAEIREQAARYQSQGFKFYGINVDLNSAAKNRKAFYRAAQIGFPILHDTELKIARQLNIKLMADSVVLRPDQSVAYRGGIKTEKDEFLLFNALNEISQGQTVSKPVGEGMGCFLVYPEKI